MQASAIKERIEVFIESAASRGKDSADESFETLALAAFAFQYDAVPDYRALCERHGSSPRSVARWQDIPMMPTRAFGRLALHAEPPRQTFRSSGTTAGKARSTHHHPYPDLYRRTIEAAFPYFCLQGLDQPPILSLVPTHEAMPDSSLSFMVDHVVERFAGSPSLNAMGRSGVDAGRARSWLSARQRLAQPVLIMATSLSLWQCLESLERLGLRFRLPPGSTIFETGGFKTREREIARRELLQRALDYLNIGTDRIVQEYGMTELTSQSYTRVLRGGDAEIFVCPAWMRARVLDPETLEEASTGETGMIAILDLANIGSVVHVLSEDLGSADGDGFRLLGRASGADLRGCSLTAEELAAGGEGC